MKVEIVAIGDELMLGFTVDSNSAVLGRELAALGVEITRRTAVGDAAGDIVTVLREALDRTGAVITTGGLGPTSDDRTRQALAELFDRELVLDEEHLAWMRERWQQRYQKPLPDTNRLQAMVPRGARKVPNRFGSAPGIWIEDAAGRWVLALPGVPRELRGMLDEVVVPMLAERSPGGEVVRSRTLRTTGQPESLLADRLRDVDGALTAVRLAYLPGLEGVDLRVTARGYDEARADRELQAALDRLRQAVGKYVYGEEAEDLAAVVLRLCRERSLTIAVAESCTGGLLGARLTAIPGSSSVVVGGVIAYHDDVKREHLGVDAAVLREHGAVSEPVVRQMAARARQRLGAGVGMAITGIAGPGGATPDKPVGTVWIAVATAERLEARLLRLWGDREEVRFRSTQACLELLRRILMQ